MESIIKKANIRINRVIKKYSSDYLFSICSSKYLIMGPYTHKELIKAELDITNQIRNRLNLIYSIFGKELLTVWNCPIITNQNFDEMSYFEKINLIIHYSNTLTNMLKKINDNDSSE